HGRRSGRCWAASSRDGKARGQEPLQPDLHDEGLWLPVCRVHRISRRCRAIALLRKKEIPHSSNRATADLACSRKERVTWVPLAVRLNFHVSSNSVANRESGAENSFM